MDGEPPQIPPQEAGAITEVYFNSPLDLTPQEIEAEKPLINGHLGEPEGSHHARTHTIAQRYFIKMLMPPETFAQNFQLNDAEKSFTKETVFDWEQEYVESVEAMPEMRGDMDLTQEHFDRNLNAILKESPDYPSLEQLAGNAVIFEGKFGVSEDVWKKLDRESDDPRSQLMYVSQQKLIDPEKFERDGKGKQVDWDKANAFLEAERAKGTFGDYVRFAAYAKILQADGVKYDRTHGMQLVKKTA